MVAIDIYLNETTRHADVILPPTTALERDHYDLVFHGLAVRNTARFSPAVFAEARRRPARLGDLPRADRCGSPRGSTGRRRCAGPAQAAAADARPAPPDSSRCCCAPAVVRRSAQLRAHPDGVDLGPLRPTMPARLQTEHHRIDLAPALVVGRPDAARGRGSPTGPRTTLVLIGRRHKQDNNSWFHNSTRLTRGRPAAPAADASRRPRGARHRRRCARRRSARGSGRCGSRWRRPTT